MAAKPYGELVLGRDLAVEAGVPLKYLSKILNDLKKAGMIDATRGTGGGYRLRRHANTIQLMEVVEVFEGERARVGCLLGSDEICSDDAGCPAHNAWKQVKQTYLNFLEQTTIAEIAKCEFTGELQDLKDDEAKN